MRNLADTPQAPRRFRGHGPLPYRRAAHQSRDSAEQANAAAGTLAAIERDRRHDELAPEFELKVAETGGEHANLQVMLAGGRLEGLEE